MAAPPFDPTEPQPAASAGWLDSTHQSVSEAVTFSASGIDNYLRREDDTATEANNSWVKMQLRERLEKSGEHAFEANIKAKLRLPHTRKRLKITFESDPDDFDSLSDRRRDQTTAKSPTRDTPSNAAIGIGLDDDIGRWQSNHNIGVQLKVPLNPFYRFQLYRDLNLPPLWSGRMKQSFAYFHSNGWQSETAVNFYRTISRNLLFQSRTAAQYLDQDHNWELVQTLSLHQRLSKNSAFEHQIGTSGDSQPQLRSSSFWIRTELRHRLYKDWLYGKVAPELFFARSNGFRMEPILLLEFEAYFGKAPDLIGR